MEINSSHKIRTFLALPVDEKYYSTLQALQFDLMSDLEGLPHAVSWTKKRRLHLTLFFLGLQFPDKLKGFMRKMDNAQDDFSQQSIHFSSNQVQLFPIERPKVIALTGHYPFALKNLREKIAHCLKIANIQPDLSHEIRGFLPHITLGTLRQPTDLKNQPFDLKVNFSEIVLFKSEMTGAHSVTHTPLQSWPLSV